jgi:hypothetical protein
MYLNLLLKLGKMKKVMIIGQVLFLGLSYQAFAKAGVADGGFEFMLTIVGLLLLVAGLFTGIEYLIKNGRNLFNKFKAFVKKKIFIPKNSV